MIFKDPLVFVYKSDYGSKQTSEETFRSFQKQNDLRSHLHSALPS